MPHPLPPDRVLRRRLEVGRILREARLWANMTQERLAEAASVDRKTISRAENGWISLTVDQLLDLADALDISPRELLPEHLPPAADDAGND